MTESRALKPVAEFRSDLGKMQEQFQHALPAHVPVERFMRVVMTLVQKTPKLLNCTRQSLFNACMAAAQDGLLPDNIEGAIVPYRDEDSGSDEVARWMPMVAGIRKKVRNSGALRDWNVQVVQEGDEFDFELGDRPFIKHKPAKRGGRNRPIIAAYSIATYPDGSMSREVMNADQIEDIRRLSRSKKGPWSNPVFYPEMARKTVARLHSKQLPMSTDLDTLLRRDDDLYDFKRARDQAREITDRQKPKSIAAALDFFGSEPSRNGSPPEEVEELPPIGEAPSAPPGPKTQAEYATYARVAIANALDGDKLQQWFASEPERKLRGACGVMRELYEELAGDVVEKATYLRNQTVR